MMRCELTQGQDGELFRRFLGLREQVKNGGIDFNYALRSMQLVAERSVKLYLLHNMSKERGWTLEEEGPKHPKGLTAAGMKLQGFLNGNEVSIPGADLKERAKKLEASFGQYTAEYLLDHQLEILKECREFFIIFPGTVWRDSYGFRRVPYLDWFGGEWRLDFFWLASWFLSDVRLLVSRS